jgi:hypothetical protein
MNKTREDALRVDPKTCKLDKAEKDLDETELKIIK